LTREFRVMHKTREGKDFPVKRGKEAAGRRNVHFRAREGRND